MGKELAKKIKETRNVEEIDVVICIPETSRIAAITVAEELKKPYCEGLIRNRFIEKMQLMPSQALRLNAMRQKFSVIKVSFVLIVSKQ